LYGKVVAEDDLAAAAVESVNARETVVVGGARFVQRRRAEILAARRAGATAHAAFAELDAAGAALPAHPCAAGSSHGAGSRARLGAATGASATARRAPTAAGPRPLARRTATSSRFEQQHSQDQDCLHAGDPWEGAFRALRRRP